MTTEPMLPGFYLNPHSINHFNVTDTPWFRDLELVERVRYVTPRYDMASPHIDGTALVWSRDREELIATIGRFSRKDADTFRYWNAISDQLNDLVFLPERFSEPLAEAERNALLRQSELGRALLEMIDQQPLHFVTNNFEHEKILLLLLLLFRLSLFGTVLYDAIQEKSPMGAVIRGFDLNAGYQICVGGSFNLARGLMETFIRNGGHFVNQAHVARITIEGGRATGIELEDGRAYRARQFVSSTVDVPQTFMTMVGREHLPSEYLARIDAFRHTGWALYGLHLCLREAPRYASAAFDPHVNTVQKCNIGCESLEQLFETHQEVAAGKIPSRISFGGGSMTVFDSSQAPRGMHTAYGWHVMPFRPNDNGPESVDDFKAEFADRMIERWRACAPNMTDENILVRWIYTPYDYTRELINMVNGDIFMGAFTADQVITTTWAIAPQFQVCTWRARRPIPGEPSQAEVAISRPELSRATSASSPGGRRSMGAPRWSTWRLERYSRSCGPRRHRLQREAGRDWRWGYAGGPGDRQGERIVIEQDLTMFTMTLTPFNVDRSLDEAALRVHLQRLVDGNNGIYLLSGGTGEGHVLTTQEARRICEVGVDVAKGKVPLYANPRESRSASDILAYAREAVAAGVDVVQFYQLDGGHGMKPTAKEQEAYWTTILDATAHPVAISIHPGVGYMASPALLSALCARYPQICAINVVALPFGYVTQVREALPDRVKIYGHISNIAQVLALGGAGALQAEGNIIPKTCRAILDAYLAGDMARVAENAQFVQKFANIVNQWSPSTARWLKMAVKVLGLGNGVLRPPYLLPGEDELQQMADAFQQLRLRQVEGIQPALASMRA